LNPAPRYRKNGMEEGFKGRGKFHSSCTPFRKPPKQKRRSAPPNLWGEYERAEQNNKNPKIFSTY
ncbi:MAG: hypothetical protein Q8P56_05575, partial [Candidatus Uhrbacteria bacterium]|nr:hypothetical protein [Candidatus Uhrbacteria bacterium]